MNLLQAHMFRFRSKILLCRTEFAADILDTEHIGRMKYIPAHHEILADTDPHRMEQHMELDRTKAKALADWEEKLESLDSEQILGQAEALLDFAAISHIFSAPLLCQNHAAPHPLALSAYMMLHIFSALFQVQHIPFSLIQLNKAVHLIGNIHPPDENPETLVRQYE
jgi:hypothetical protein